MSMQFLRKKKTNFFLTVIVKENSMNKVLYKYNTAIPIACIFMILLIALTQQSHSFSFYSSASPKCKVMLKYAKDISLTALYTASFTSISLMGLSNSHMKSAIKKVINRHIEINKNSTDAREEYQRDYLEYIYNILQSNDKKIVICVAGIVITGLCAAWKILYLSTDEILDNWRGDNYVVGQAQPGIVQGIRPGEIPPVLIGEGHVEYARSGL